MSILNQKTIKTPIEFEGITLHKGKIAKVKILPAKPNSGIVFKRTDIKGDNLIEANFLNVSDATLCTTLTNKSGASVSTVEHLIAALYGKGVDNALIEIDNDEVPIKDGSSKFFVEKIDSVGLENSDKSIKIIKILKKITLKDGQKTISMEPTKTSLEIDFEIKFNNAVIKNHADLAVGAVIGSNIANLILVMAATSFFIPISNINQNQINQAWINIFLALVLITMSFFILPFNFLFGILAILPCTAAIKFS